MMTPQCKNNNFLYDFPWAVKSCKRHGPWSLTQHFVFGLWNACFFFYVLRSESLVPVLFIVWIFIVFIFFSYLVFHSCNVLVFGPLFIIFTLCSLCLLVKFSFNFFKSLLVNPLSYFLFYFILSFILCVLCLVLILLSCLAWLVSAVFPHVSLPRYFSMFRPIVFPSCL